MTSHKAAISSGRLCGASTTIGGRRFTRSRGRIVCYERSESVKSRGIEELHARSFGNTSDI